MTLSLTGDPFLIEAEEDELFILAPSVIFAERLEQSGRLFEGKSVGTAREIDLLFLDLDQTIRAKTRPKQFAAERKKGVTVGRRILDRVQETVKRDLLKVMQKRDRGGFKGYDDFHRAAVSVMKPAWKEVFEAGVRASGMRGTGSTDGPVVKLSQDDQKWLRSAMAHEMRFLNGFTTAVEEGTWKMPLPRRVDMYAKTLEAFYDSARVIGLPATVTIHWTGENDERTCVGCKYLFEHSPYTKKTLPTVPRAGMTPCLSNCRDKLLIRQSTSEAVISLTNQSLTRGTHVKNLRKLKAEGHL